MFPQIKLNHIHKRSMKIKIKIFIISCLFSMTGFTQSLSPKVIASQGGFAAAGGVSISFTIGQTANATLNSSASKLSQGFQQPEVNIITGIIVPLAFCAGSTVNVPYAANGLIDNANVFTAQLSNALGNFTNPVTIGARTATTSGNILATLPVNTTTGTGYRIRVVSSHPDFNGTNNGSNISISASSLSIACPQNMVVDPTSFTGSIVNYPAPIVIASCSGSITNQIAGLSSGSIFPVGITVNTFEVKDAYGSIATCSFTIEVKDPFCDNNIRDKKVYVCDKGKTMCISVNALQSFLKKGAKLGQCEWYNNITTSTAADNSIAENKHDKELPQLFSFTAYPNPFKDVFQIQYNVPFASKVIIKIYDLLGREAGTIVNEEKTAGIYIANYQASKLMSGSYFCRMIATGTTKEYTQTIQIIKQE